MSREQDRGDRLAFGSFLQQIEAERFNGSYVVQCRNGVPVKVSKITDPITIDSPANGHTRGSEGNPSTPAR